MPFLGPIIVAWVTLGVGVLAYYFLFVARTAATKPTRAQTERPRPQWGDQRLIRPWVQTPTGPPGTDLPTYDMEDFPTGSWGSPPATA